MTQKIFGIDLGTNSIGTSVRNTDLVPPPEQCVTL